MLKEVKFWIDGTYIEFCVDDQGDLSIATGNTDEMFTFLEFTKEQTKEIIQSLNDLLQVKSWQTNGQ